MNKLTTEEFIERARKVHGDKYDYSNTVYVDQKTKVEIFCPNHGSFWQDPSSHLQGHGCKKCYVENKLTKLNKEEFIRRANLVYGPDAFDYSLTVWNGYTEKVKIICKKCGNVFERLPQNHLRGQMCEGCYKKVLSERETKTTEQFILESKQKFGDRFNYSDVEYTGKDNPITLYCPVHGKFETTPEIHLHRRKFGGCKKCVEEFKRVIKKIDSHDEEFVQTFKEELVAGKTYEELSQKYNVSSHQLGVIARRLGLDKFKTIQNLSSGERNTIAALKSLGIDTSLNTTRVYDIEGRNSNFVIPDFILDFDNATYWIEYNGKQHYVYNSHYYHNSEEEFESQIKRDSAVRNYCKENNIKLIEIPYTYQGVSSISELLDKVIFHNQSPSSLIDYNSLYYNKDIDNSENNKK